MRVTLADPNFQVAKVFNRELFGAHPYAIVDASMDSIARFAKADLQAFHRHHFVPSNAFLVVAGDVDPREIFAKAEHAFGAWSGAAVAPVRHPAVRAPAKTKVVLVHRPGSVQSVIRIGNPGLKRSSPDYIALLVANQVLGGSAASRLFLDLRERRSLTYGAYSRFSETVEVGSFRASASVRSEVTEQAYDAFFEHLRRITAEAPSAEEMQNARRYLSDSFALMVETVGNLADMVSDLRLYGLPQNYWSNYRARIEAVNQADVLRVARRYITPNRSLVVLVGTVDTLADRLRTRAGVGEVTVEPAEDPDGPTAAPGAAAPATPAAPR
jgi:zinc protease